MDDNAVNLLTTSYSIEDPTSGTTYNLSRSEDEIAKSFNQVRFRAGLPGLSNAEMNSATTVQQLMERERMVEFLFEDRRYFDVRRWGKYEETERDLIMGVNTETTGEGYYSIVPINHFKARNRVIDKKLVLFPIALDEVRKASSLDQNPGWQN